MPPPDDTLQALSKLSLKQHAVMLAIFGGLTNTRTAELMRCNRSIVQGHLNAALTHLRCTDRAHLIEQWGPRVDRIEERAYRAHFGLSKRWFDTEDVHVIERLTVKKAKGPPRSVHKSSS